MKQQWREAELELVDKTRVACEGLPARKISEAALKQRSV